MNRPEHLATFTSILDLLKTIQMLAADRGITESTDIRIIFNSLSGAAKSIIQSVPLTAEAVTMAGLDLPPLNGVGPAMDGMLPQDGALPPNGPTIPQEALTIFFDVGRLLADGTIDSYLEAKSKLSPAGQLNALSNTLVYSGWTLAQIDVTKITPTTADTLKLLTDNLLKELSIYFIGLLENSATEEEIRETLVVNVDSILAVVRTIMVEFSANPNLEDANKGVEFSAILQDNLPSPTFYRPRPALIGQ